MDLKPFQIPAQRPEAVDVPLAEVVAEVNAQALREAYKHQPEPFEAEFAQLACDCPDACSCTADYPGFAEWIAAREAANRKVRPAKETS
jgi:hypothetical protein